MSKSLQVRTAVKQLAIAALPGADVQGLTDDAERARRIPPNGLVTVRDGDPGEPEIDLSPILYHYEHEIPIELGAFQGAVPLREALDIMAAAIGAGVAADRTLGGLCDWLDVTALELVNLVSSAPGSATQLGGRFTIIASYSTPSPLG